MRKWVVLAVVVLAVAAIWPVVVGTQVEGTVAETHEAQLGEVYLRHEMLEYERGYLAASGRSRLILEDADGRFEIPLVHAVRHGLLGARGDSFVDLDTLAAPDDSLLAHLLRSLDLQVHSRSGIGGGVTTRIAFDDLRMDLMSVPEVAEHAATVGGPLWLDLAAGQGRFAWSSEQILVSLDLPETRLSDASFSWEAREARYATVFEADADGVFGRLPDYEGGLAAAVIELREGEATRLHLERPRLDAFQHTNNDRMDSRLRLQVDHARVDDGAGDALTLTALDLQAGILRWDRPSMLQFLAELEAVDARGIEGEQRNALIGSAMIDALGSMIEHQPAIQLRASLNDEPPRQVALDAELGLHGTQQSLTTRPLETLRLDSDLRLGLEWVAEFDAAYPDIDLDAQLHALAADGWVRRDAEAGYWHGTLAMADGRVRINDVDRTAMLLALLFAFSGGMF
ncbi:hypothetical protein TVD_09655 [Thioalkalivibrio versutus]|uniref:DUF945 domain-containing protein n=1 Tax=Thioalkalivibrio versutus TaxID=106634 RepID=A0A0G3G303_9GAMM|nr:DUF945 family protein [Thioalkalivibrio versutus]AKJ95605.1 hypothetical protein TVD_09655 [Thioalkalivibrio versutus]